MTILDLLLIASVVVLLVAAVVGYLRLRRYVSDADGLGDVNTRGPAGEREAGDVVASLGEDVDD